MMPDTPASKPGLTILGKLFVALVIAGCIAGAYYLFATRNPTQPAAPGAAPTGTPAAANSNTPPPAGTVEIGIAYGTEKERWLKWATEQFAQTPAGQQIKINLLPMGSLEGAQAVLKADHRINVWSPASSVYKDIFLQEWQIKENTSPIVNDKGDPLALSPMVFVMWDERYQAFVSKYKTVSFATVGQALAEKGGWDAIAGHAEWGLFKFGHTHPNQSNSGLMTLVLMAYDYHQKSTGLTLKDILNTDFQQWMDNVEHSISGSAGGLSNSTGNLMKEMILKGPSSYDGVFVYESVAIDYLKNAEGRWGKLHVVYPKYNLWNDNPYYIMNVSWSTPEQRKAAEAFENYLLSEPVQKESLVHGFRPGNPSVPIKFAESPFVVYQSAGLTVDMSTMCDPPSAEVINNLLASWQRTQGSR